MTGDRIADVTADTRSTYDAIAHEYARRWNGTPNWLIAELDRLAGLLPDGARVADVGCGPGHHTELLRERGLRAAGFDLSREMLASLAVQGVAQADMRALPLAPRSLDAVWCAAAMLHVPRPDVPRALAEFGRVLRSGGELVLIVAEGDGEGWEEVPYQQDVRRWYVYHRLDDLAARLATAGFTVAGAARRPANRDWLHIHARRG